MPSIKDEFILSRSGKSVLASVIIEACINHKQHRTAYYYCSSDDSTTLSCLAILKGLLIQQTLWYPNLVSYFYEQLQQKGEPVLTQENTAKQLFEIVAWGGDRQYIILDGLDGCQNQERNSIISFLASLVSRIDAKEPSKVRLLVVSQKEPDIGRLLEHRQEFEIKADDNAQEIEIFVRAWMRRLREKFGLESEIATSLEDRICMLAKGMKSSTTQIRLLTTRRSILVCQTRFGEPVSSNNAVRLLC